MVGWRGRRVLPIGAAVFPALLILAQHLEGWKSTSSAKITYRCRSLDLDTECIKKYARFSIAFDAVLSFSIYKDLVIKPAR